MKDLWYKQSASVNDDRRWAQLRQELGWKLGSACLSMAVLMLGWCKNHNVVSMPMALILAEGIKWGFPAALVPKLVDWLVTWGLLANVPGEDVFMPLGASTEHPLGPAPTPEDVQKKRDKWKEKKRGQRAKTKDVPQGDSAMSPGGQDHVPGGQKAVPGDRQGTGGGQPGDTSPADTTVTRACTRESSEIEEETETEGEGSAPAEPALPPEVVEDSKPRSLALPTLQAPAPQAPLETQPAGQQEPAAAAPKAKPRKPRALPARSALAAAWASGVSAATGAPCSPPSARWALESLEAMAATHAAGRVGAELLGWLTEQGRDFATLKAGDRFIAGKGFTPEACRGWLDGGAVDRPAPPKAPGPPVPRISPHPRGLAPSRPQGPTAAPTNAAGALVGIAKILATPGSFELGEIPLTQGPPPRDSLPPLDLPRRSPEERAQRAAEQRAALAKRFPELAAPRPEEPSA